MSTFIFDTQGNKINIANIAIAKPYGENCYQVKSCEGENIAIVRKDRLDEAITQIIPADGWELVEKFAHENSWQIISTPVMYFGLLASGEVKPFTYTEADFRDSSREFWRHKSSPQILNPFCCFENEADFLNDGGGDEK